MAIRAQFERGSRVGVLGAGSVAISRNRSHPFPTLGPINTRRRAKWWGGSGWMTTSGLYRTPWERGFFAVTRRAGALFSKHQGASQPNGLATT